MSSSHLIWYISRAGGMMAWALLTGAVFWGLALSTRSLRRWAKPSWVLDLHRYLGGLALIFVGIHVGAVMLDTYVHFGFAEVLLPLASSWHPVAVAWGIVAMYLMVAVEATSLVRRWLSPRAWRRVHYASLPVFALATVHGLTAGTDRTNMAVIAAAVAAVVAVGSLVGIRASRWAEAAQPGASTLGAPSRRRASRVEPVRRESVESARRASVGDRR